MNMIKFLIFFLIVLLNGTSCAYPNYYRFGTGGQVSLCVPSQEMDQNTLPDDRELVDFLVGNGRTSGFGFYFDGERLLDSIPEFRIRREFFGHPYVNGLSGSIGFLGGIDVGRFDSSMRARDTEDIWYASELCPHPNVVRLGDADLYRVKCKKGDDYSSIWNKQPEKDLPFPDPGELVVATCRYQNIKNGPFSGHQMRTCHRVFVTTKYIVDYQVQEENLVLVEELDRFLRTRLLQWQENCSLSRSIGI